MRFSWTLASIFLSLCCSTVLSIPVGTGIPENSRKHPQAVSPRQSVDYSPTQFVVSEVDENDSLLDSLLTTTTEGAGHPTLHQPHDMASTDLPESHQEFAEWMDSTFENGLQKHISGFLSQHASTKMAPLSSPHGSHRHFSLTLDTAPHSAHSHIASDNSRSKSKMPMSDDLKGIGDGKKKKKKKKRADRWHLNYNEVQQKRLRTYYSKVSDEYQLTTATNSSLTNEMIRNTPKQLRDRIANGLIIRDSSGGQIRTDEDPISPAKRRFGWSVGLSDENVKSMLQFGDRLMSHRRAISSTVKNKLLSSLTSEEVNAVKNGNQEEMNRIEARLMPLRSGKSSS